MSFVQSTVADFIQSLQKAKAAQGPWAALALSEREVALAKALEILNLKSQDFAQSEAQAQGLAVDFVEQVAIKRSIQVFTEVLAQLKNPTKAAMAQPVGIISVILPRALSLRFAIEMIVPALAAGNAVMIKTSSHSQSTGLLIKEIFAGLPEGLVHVLNGSRQSLGELFSGHPSIKALAFSGQHSSAEKIAKSAVAGFKKMKLYMNGSNSALVLDGADLKLTVQALCESCFTGAGSLRESISKILVLESMQAAFFEEFSRAAQDFVATKMGSLNETQKSRLLALINQVPVDAGKIAWGSSETAAIVKDLSHCSVMQQDALSAPMAIVSAVKYQHEMLKWANTGYLGVCAQVFGPAEKVLKVSQKLEVGKVYINSWLREDPSLGWGQKSSVYGIEDSQVFGAFFSECRLFVGAS